MAARTCGRISFAPGLFQFRGPPDQSVASLSWRRSFVTPPKIIAPSRPLPTGSASVQRLAGSAYFNVKSPANAGAAAISKAVNNKLIPLR